MFHSSVPYVLSPHINSALCPPAYLPGPLTHFPIKHICQVVLQSLLEHSQAWGTGSLLKFQAAFVVRKFTYTEHQLDSQELIPNGRAR